MGKPFGWFNNANVGSMRRHIPLYVGICVPALLRPTLNEVALKSGDWVRKRLKNGNSASARRSRHPSALAPHSASPPVPTGSCIASVRKMAKRGNTLGEI